MNDLIINTNDNTIIEFGDVTGIELQPGWQKYENYEKPWPKGLDNKRLPKGLCKWSPILFEVEAKTQDDIDAEKAEEEKQELYEEIRKELPELLLDAKTKGLTFEQFLDTISAITT